MLHDDLSTGQGNFFKRVFTRLGLMMCIGMLLVAAFAWQIMQHWLSDYNVEQLRNSAHLATRVVAGSWSESSASLQEGCLQIKNDTGLRTTVILPDGDVIADSDAPAKSMANHSDRPEVIEALQGRIGVNRRLSASVGHSFVYVAAPLIIDGATVAIVRIAAPFEDLARRERVIWQLIAAGLCVALPLALMIAWFMSRGLAAPIQRVGAWANRLGRGDLATRLEVEGDDEIRQVAAALDRMRRNLSDRIQEAHQQRRDLAITIGTLEEGVIAVNQEGIVLLVNPAAIRILGIAHSLVGGPIVEQIPDRGLRRLWEETTSSGSKEVRREIILTSNGVARTVDALIIHVVDTETPIAWLMCLRDITAIAKSVAMKSDFVANASHELRTPVAAIRAAVDTLREPGLDANAQARFMAMIDRNLMRLQALTDDLMNLSKVESVNIELNYSTFDLEEVYAGLRATFGQVLSAKQATFTMKSDVGPIHTDQRWLELILKNLIDNAVKFIPEGGRIKLSCRREDKFAVFEVEDDGCGIPMEDIDRVFERFYQVDRSRGMNQGGTGLGLAIVKHAVNAMQGKVAIRSKVGEGTVVSFQIPAFAENSVGAEIDARDSGGS
ncbi:MAG: HAMP domain-containing protein [Planctomycetia bacterium]|jgi:two-component system phosphate regulon sensor histidine kinase PhoR|nr:HAMP domain-containing protein [Planctomycetia bacterium]MCC7316704.1 HAMP domain-containing protein [Planctomycetota bacterium]